MNKYQKAKMQRKRVQSVIVDDGPAFCLGYKEGFKEANKNAEVLVEALSKIEKKYIEGVMPPIKAEVYKAAAQALTTYRGE